MSGPLERIKVLEVANWVAVPSACAMLADLGAEVTKVEHSRTGDPARSINVSTRGVAPYAGGLNVGFELLNRGKRSIGVNLEKPEGQEVVRRLATTSDIMVTNLLPSRQERYGLQYEDIVALNPRIVYLVLTGYGPEGPDRDRPGFDYAAFWARSGIMATLGEQNGLPVQQRPGMGDQTTSLAILAAIGIALYERERSGRGQRIDCSLLHTGLWVLGIDTMAALREHSAAQRHARREVGNPLFNYYQTKGGRWIQLAMIESERFWPGFCRALDMEHLVADPRFDSHAHRTEHNRELVTVLDERLATRTLGEWAQRLDQEKCIWAPVQTLDEVVNDRQVRSNGYIAALRHPEEGEYEILAAPMKFRRTPGEVKEPAPGLGQHTEVRLLEEGYTWADIVALKEHGAII